MSKVTPIEWCDSTVNPTSGCDGCELYSSKDPAKAICYARAIHETRFALQPRTVQPGSAPSSWARNYAPTFSEVRMIPGRCREAAYWTDLRGKDRIGKPWLTGRPRCIFVGDLSDVMSAAVTDQYIEDEIFAPMEMPAGRRHVWMILTKRPKRLADLSAARAARNGYGLPRNCIAMTSVTNQATALARLSQLEHVRARWRGVSFEPLLDAVDAAPWLHFIDWAIIGGSSGKNATITPVDWIKYLANQCVEAGRPTFVKQLGSLPVRYVTAGETSNITLHPDERCKVLHLRDPKGGDPAEWPASLAIREMPEFPLDPVEPVGAGVENTEVSD